MPATRVAPAASTPLDSLTTPTVASTKFRLRRCQAPNSATSQIFCSCTCCLFLALEVVEADGQGTVRLKQLCCQQFAYGFWLR